MGVSACVCVHIWQCVWKVCFGFPVKEYQVITRGKMENSSFWSHLHPNFTFTWAWWIGRPLRGPCWISRLRCIFCVWYTKLSMSLVIPRLRNDGKPSRSSWPISSKKGKNDHNLRLRFYIKSYTPFTDIPLMRWCSWSYRPRTLLSSLSWLSSSSPPSQSPSPPSQSPSLN